MSWSYKTMTRLFTVGHSTREIHEFIELLKSHAITQLVDIRTIPKSRHNPQYGQSQLKKSLEKHGIKYVYLKELGGLRPAVKNSTNDAWHNKSFRNYADYMQSDEFKRGLDELIKLSQEATTVIMCAEAVPWRCHRSLVSDALQTRGMTVEEIINSGNTRPHTMTPFAVVDGTEIHYPKSALKEETKDG
jgi:uncharacterized protein (DUF488 family)